MDSRQISGLRNEHNVVDLYKNRCCCRCTTSFSETTFYRSRTPVIPVAIDPKIQPVHLHSTHVCSEIQRKKRFRLEMDKWAGKVAVVTGASSGIGEETARQLVQNGMIVVGIARRDERLRELEKELQGKSGQFYYLKIDLCSEEDILKAFKWIKNTLKTVDVLVNNAGVWKSSDLLGNTSDWKQMFDTNVIALNICSREAIKIMQETNVSEGHIINVNSIVGHFQVPYIRGITVYSATKFSVTAITENLRDLMCQKKLPIRVTSISPGAVETQMIADHGLDKLPGFTMLKSIDVADAILYALSVPKRVNISEIIIRPMNENMSFFIKNC